MLVVNEGVSSGTRHKIIQRLFEAETPVSGQGLSEELGISRVAVWKHIQALQQQGCSISSCSKGYILDHLPEGLNSWNFPRLDFPLLVKNSCFSTMDTAREALQSYDPPFAVAADSQEHGISGNGEEWPSDNGGIYCTAVINPVLDFSSMGLYNGITVLAVCRILHRRNIDICCSWPRGLFLDGQKIGGVITELIGPFDAPLAVSLGIGLYVHNQLKGRCRSLEELLKESLSRRDLLEEMLLEVQKIIDNPRGKPISTELYSYCLQAGKICSFRDQKGCINGMSSEGDLVFVPEKSKKEIFIGSWDAKYLKIYSGDSNE